MDQIGINNNERRTRLEALSKQEVITSHVMIEAELERVVRELYFLKNQKINDEQLQLIVTEQIAELKDTIYGKKSERYKKPVNNDDDDAKKPAKQRPKKLSERYPNIPINEVFVELEPIPACPCCNKTMIDSDMTEDCEQLTVIPKKYEITRFKRVKYVCDCHQAIVTAPPIERIIPGSAYSDEMITDVALSKYCDLIPINRYVAMADRAGIKDLPANSLIETTHSFADFVSPVYTLIKQGILRSRVLKADETPHRMLEGDDKDRWVFVGVFNRSFVLSRVSQHTLGRYC
jgi:transposase